MRSTGGRGVTVVTLVTLFFAPFFNGHTWYDRLVGKSTSVQTITCAVGDPCPESSHQVQQVTLTGVDWGSLAVGFPIEPATLPAGHQGIAYSASLTAPAAAQPVTFTTDGNGLPPGLALSAGGTLSGTPTAGGSFSFVVQASDANGDLASRAVHVAIGAGTPGRRVTPGADELEFESAGVGGAPQTRTLTIASTGTAPLDVGAPVVSGSPAFTAASTCPASLPVGESCTVTVRFAPSGAGKAKGSLTVPTSGGDVTVSLEGSGYERVAASAGGGMFVSGGTGKVRVEWAYRVATNRPVVKGKHLVVRWGTHVFQGAAASSLELSGATATVVVSGSLDGVDGAQVVLVSTDNGEPGGGADTVSVTVTPPAGMASAALSASGTLVSGNVGNRLI